MKTINLLFALFCLPVITMAQSVGIGGNNFIPNPSSILELQHDSKGLLIPRLTTNQRTAINAPAKGLIIFNTETNHFEFWDGARWVEMCNDCQNDEIPGTATQTLSHDGTTWVANSVIRTDGVTVGIGTPPSVYDLDVDGTVNAVGYRMIAGAANGKVMVSGADGLFEWADPVDVLDQSIFKISELDSVTIAPQTPANAGKGIVIGSRILGDPDFTLPVEWESRMFFDAATTNAFRAGTSNNGAWNPVNLGVNSFASGYNTVASGLQSLAMGDHSVASDTFTIAMGKQSIASSNNAIAIGQQAEASGIASIAMGNQSVALGGSSMAIGNNSSASKSWAFAMGNAANADGLKSFALGNTTNASGDFSFALGNNVQAKSGYEVIIGRYESPHTPAHTKNWISTDRLFSVANGTSTTGSDAFVVRKNGRAGIGSQTTSAQLHVSGEDGLLVTGLYGSGADIEVTGAGTRMLFNPQTAAFRAGFASSTEWDHANVGSFSFAVGSENLASGTYSSALGYRNTASGTRGMVWGESSAASGSWSTAAGFTATASGRYAMAMGTTITAPSGFEMVIGRWNTTYTPSSTTGWNTADRLFVVGNGTATGSRSDAMVILKDGNVGIGNSSPAARLDVAGDALINGHTVGRGGGNVSNNVAVGLGTLAANLTGGVSNTAVGSRTLDRNTTGDYQVAIGQDALSNNTTGSRSVAIGYQAMGMNATGTNIVSNVAIGYRAAGKTTTGYGNIIIGEDAGLELTTGYDNVWIGKQIGNSGTPNYNNSTAIGNNTPVDASNKARVGNSSVTSNGGQVTWTAYSDARIKDNVAEEVVGLEFIKALRPVTYNFNVDRQNALQGVESENFEGKYDIEKIKFTGFIAQEVEAAAKSVGYDFSGVDNSGELLGLRYAEFTVPLVKAVQELTELLDERTARIEELEKTVKQLLE